MTKLNQINDEIRDLECKINRLSRIKESSKQVTCVFGGESFDIDEENILHVRNARFSKSVKWDESWPAHINNVAPLLSVFKHVIIHWSQNDGPKSIWALEHTGAKCYVDARDRDRMVCYDERVYHEVFGEKRSTLGFFMVEPGTETFLIGGKAPPNQGGW